MSGTQHIEALFDAVKNLRDSSRKFDKLCEKTSRDGLNQKQLQKANADANWQAMDLEKARIVAHVAAVDAGIADMRSGSYYERREFHPSGFHSYIYSPPKPHDFKPSERLDELARLAVFDGGNL